MPPPQNVRFLFAGRSRIVPFDVLRNSKFFNAIYHEDVTCMTGDGTCMTGTGTSTSQETSPDPSMTDDVDTDIDTQDHQILDTFPENVVSHAIDVILFTYHNNRNPTPADIPELPTDSLAHLMRFATFYDL